MKKLFKEEQNMDKKAILRLQEFHKIFNERNFMETEVSAFVSFIRDYLSHGTLREICNFNIHRSRKNGPMSNVADRIYKKLLSITPVANDEGALKDFTSKLKEVFKLYKKNEMKFKTEMIEKELNDFFEKYNFIKLDNEVVTDIILCIMGLLQDVSIYKDSKKICRFEMSISKDNILLSLCFNVPFNEDFDISFKGEIMKLMHKTDTLYEEYQFATNENTFPLKRKNGRLVFQIDNSTKHEIDKIYTPS